MPIEMPSVEVNGWYTLEQARQLIPGRDGRPISASSVRNWIRDGKIKSRRIGGTHWISGEEIARVLKGGEE